MIRISKEDFHSILVKVTKSSLKLRQKFWNLWQVMTCSFGDKAFRLLPYPSACSKVIGSMPDLWSNMPRNKVKSHFAQADGQGSSFEIWYYYFTGYSFWDRFRNLHELFCQFPSWTNLVNSGKFMDNCWISCQVMADMEIFYGDLIIIDLYLPAPACTATASSGSSIFSLTMSKEIET